MPTYICPQCVQVVNGNSICCDKCNKWYHSNCTNLTEHEFQTHLKNKYKNWKCESCIDKYCNRCNKTFPASNFDSICCEKCERWYHINCTNLTSSAFNDYCNNKDKNWKCNTCILKFCRKCVLTIKC